jgi:hypothetical protein
MGYELLCIADIHIPKESETRVFSRRIELVRTVLPRTKKDSVKPENTHGYELECHAVTCVLEPMCLTRATDLP